MMTPLLCVQYTVEQRYPWVSAKKNTLNFAYRVRSTDNFEHTVQLEVSL